MAVPDTPRHRDVDLVSMQASAPTAFGGDASAPGASKIATLIGKWRELAAGPQGGVRGHGVACVNMLMLTSVMACNDQGLRLALDQPEGDPGRPIPELCMVLPRVPPLHILVVMLKKQTSDAYSIIWIQ